MIPIHHPRFKRQGMGVLDGQDKLRCDCELSYTSASALKAATEVIQPVAASED